MSLLVPLSPADRPSIAATFSALADYLTLERGSPDTEAPTEEFLTNAPPGVDPATSLRLAVAGPAGGFDGLVELAFGYPGPAAAYVGLMLLVPAARSSGLGSRVLAEIEDLSRRRGCTALYLAVLDKNPRGRAFWLREGFAPDAPPRQIEIGGLSHAAQRLVKRL